MTIPYVIEKDGRGERTYDLYSRLLEDRIIFLAGEVNPQTANSVVGQMLYLETKDPTKDIYLYINSPGGTISDGMAIYDTMNYVKCDVSTICIGLAASMGAFLLSSGTKGKRFALANSEVMIHQPSGGVQGQATEIAIVAQRIIKIRNTMNEILARNTSQPIEKIIKDVERDYYMTAQEALEYGIVDKVYTSREESK